MNSWGQIFCWGDNSFGQLGLDVLPNIVRIPKIVKALGANVVIQIACGQKHTVALTNNGEVYSWGSNNEGQLGFGQNITMEKKPRLIKNLQAIPISFIACGSYHSIVVSKSGKQK